MRPAGIAVAGALALLALPNCNGDMCACPPIATPAQVKGQVTGADNTAVAGAVVRAYSAPPATGCTPIHEDFGGIETSADGSFRLWLPSMAHQEDVCVLVFARPPRGSTGLTNSDTVLVILDFDHSGIDSTEVQLVLRAAT